MDIDAEMESALAADAEKLAQIGLDSGDHTSVVVRDVEAERRRQVVKEGYSNTHDDGYTHSELVYAAICYAREAGCSDEPKALYGIVDPSDYPDDWPWDVGYWKPKTKRDDLVRAAALLIAEIERIDRASKLDV
jgi:hypothetical protein